MEHEDLELIQTLMPQNEELKRLMTEHDEFEQKIEDLNSRAYLSPEDAIERKRLQKLKLSGRDRIEQIIAEYRKNR
jgi:uncharacterized protein YdcH (DUF465 family)